MVDRKKVKELFQHLKSYTEKLAVLSEFSVDEFKADDSKVDVAKDLSKVSVETVLNISLNILASEGFRSPRSYGESFKILVENNIFPREFLLTSNQMVQYRNSLIHLSWQMDEKKIYDSTVKLLGDLNQFIGLIQAYLESETASENCG